MPDGKQIMGHRVTVRLDIELYQMLKEKSKEYGMDMSKYVRYIFEKEAGKTKKEPVTMEERILRKELIYEINKIGTNINQIVKNVNSHFYSHSDKEQLFGLLKEVYMKVADYSGSGSD